MSKTSIISKPVVGASVFVDHESISAAAEDIDANDFEALQPIPFQTRSQIPNDSRWALEESFARKTVFANWGHREILGVLNLAWINLVWNGVVVYLLMFLNRGQPLESSLASILVLYLATAMFALIGLVLLVCFLAMLFEPFRVTRMEFNENGISKTTIYFGIPFVRRWTVGQEIGLQLAFIQPSQTQLNINTSKVREDWYFAICFSKDKSEIFRWKGLTESEAQWIASVLIQNASYNQRSC